MDSPSFMTSMIIFYSYDKLPELLLSESSSSLSSISDILPSFKALSVFIKFRFGLGSLLNFLLSNLLFSLLFIIGDFD